MTTAASPLQALLAGLAEEKRLAGKVEDAILLLDHLVALDPLNSLPISQLIALLIGQNRLLPALEKILALKQLAAKPDEVLNLYVEPISAGVMKFKELAEGGRLEEAESFITLLAKLMPDSPVVIPAAMQFHHQTEQHNKSVPYARTVLRMEPNHSEALLVLIDEARRKGDAAAETALRIAKMDHNTDSSAVHQAHNIYELVNVMMCQTLSEADLDTIDRAQEILRAIPRPDPEQSKGDAWTRFYQAMVGAIRMAPLREPPAPKSYPLPPLFAADGSPILFPELRERALRHQAEAVFLVAGDEGYVKRYARLYVRSVLRNADVSALVIVHVIGGQKRIKKIAQEIDVADDRFVLSCDDFDASAVASRVYDAPSQPQTDKPIGHYQCARFRVASLLLYGLQLPLFVTDIDLMLERGVADLLVTHGDKDMVLNENWAVVQFASRLTANLLLLFPTDRSRRYIQFLANYLDVSLEPMELPKFVDQIAMLVARHHVQRLYPDVRIAYFDVDADINNCVFPYYMEHPFRFLSLYQKFDLTTLPAY